MSNIPKRNSIAMIFCILAVMASVDSMVMQHHRQKLPQTTSDIDRRSLLKGVLSTSSMIIATTGAPFVASAKCTDIESCREIGDSRVAQDLKENPVTSLDSGVRFKTLNSGVRGPAVKEGSSVDIIYSISRAGGPYMYSQGFGFEKVDIGNGQIVKDLDVDFLRVDKVGSHQDVPVGIEQAMIGMQRGEKRRVELPPNVGLATSNWNPAPKSKAGKQSIVAYQRIVDGFGSQPAFPAPLVWEVEVLRVR
ncbi:unnamed protein product [Cylindrotheca closterium]|uniref:PPIase FKBP-type domain-containing protein n=1 Tax=Cylindrotheca closterium TaxID=2856 RepID=A0AAD2FCN1_9STRA|nr:unnamed protein product [Cylindrotheca closterium]